MRNCGQESVDEPDDCHFPPISHALFRQLLDLQVDLVDRRWVGPALSVSPIVVFHVTFELDLTRLPNGTLASGRRGLFARVPRLPARYVQLTELDASHPRDLATAARTVVEQLAALEPGTLQLLLVPAKTMRPPPRRVDCATVEAQECLAEACSSRGVALRTYVPSRPLDGLLVPEFGEYLREEAVAAGGVSM